MATAKEPEAFLRALQNLEEEVILRETHDWVMLMQYV
jgi:hypothetical protein